MRQIRTQHFHKNKQEIMNRLGRPLIQQTSNFESVIFDVNFAPCQMNYWGNYGPIACQSTRCEDFVDMVHVLSPEGDVIII